MIAVLAIRKRNAASCVGEKLSNPNLVAINAIPQIMATITAKKVWIGFTLEAYCIYLSNVWSSCVYSLDLYHQ